MGKGACLCLGCMNEVFDVREHGDANEDIDGKLDGGFGGWSESI